MTRKFEMFVGSSALWVVVRVVTLLRGGHVLSHLESSIGKDDWSLWQRDIADNHADSLDFLGSQKIAGSGEKRAKRWGRA